MERISKDESDIQNITIKWLINVSCTDIGWATLQEQVIDKP